MCVGSCVGPVEWTEDVCIWGHVKMYSIIVGLASSHQVSCFMTTDSFGCIRQRLIMEYMGMRKMAYIGILSGGLLEYLPHQIWF